VITTTWARGLSWQPGFDQTAKDLAILAKNVEDRYVGGTPFFDSLDEALRSDHWFQPLRMWYEHTHTRNFGVWPDIALSGAFGQRFAAYLRENGTHNTYVFPGNLRHVDLDALPIDLTGHRFVFIDDSCYRGRTYGKIKRRIEEAGGTMLDGMVLYDGSPLPPFLPSFYRYHLP